MRQNPLDLVRRLRCTLNRRTRCGFGRIFSAIPRYPLTKLYTNHIAPPPTCTSQSTAPHNAKPLAKHKAAKYNISKAIFQVKALLRSETITRVVCFHHTSRDTLQCASIQYKPLLRVPTVLPHHTSPSLPLLLQRPAQNTQNKKVETHYSASLPYTNQITIVCL